MRTSTQEGLYWWPLLACGAILLVAVLKQYRTDLLLCFMAVFQPELFDKIEQLRRGRGQLTVDCAVELVAEQEGVDSEELMMAHFSYCLDRGMDRDSEANHVDS